MSRLINSHHDTGKKIWFVDWQFQPLRTLRKARLEPTDDRMRFFPSLQDANSHAQGSCASGDISSNEINPDDRAPRNLLAN